MRSDPDEANRSQCEDASQLATASLCVLSKVLHRSSLEPASVARATVLCFTASAYGFIGNVVRS
jgi:hypothetical protein